MSWGPLTCNTTDAAVGFTDVEKHVQWIDTNTENLAVYVEKSGSSSIFPVTNIILALVFVFI